jgi:hypothetical protein
VLPAVQDRYFMVRLVDRMGAVRIAALYSW